MIIYRNDGKPLTRGEMDCFKDIRLLSGKQKERMLITADNAYGVWFVAFEELEKLLDTYDYECTIKETENESFKFFHYVLSPLYIGDVQNEKS